MSLLAANTTIEIIYASSYINKTPGDTKEIPRVQVISVRLGVSSHWPRDCKDLYRKMCAFIYSLWSYLIFVHLEWGCG